MIGDPGCGLGVVWDVVWDVVWMWSGTSSGGGLGVVWVWSGMWSGMRSGRGLGVVGDVVWDVVWAWSGGGLGSLRTSTVRVSSDPPPIRTTWDQFGHHPRTGVEGDLRRRWG